MLLDRTSVGLVEDDPVMGESLVQRLELEGAKVEWWKSAKEAQHALSSDHGMDAIICDIRLPDGSGEEVFRSVADGVNPPPFLFMTGYADVGQAVGLIRDGAGDYLSKPFDMSDFLKRVASLVRSRPDTAESVLGVSPAMASVERLLLRIARASSNVLITGETGAGKEVCARFLHEKSVLSSGPFIAVNCAAIPEDLLESELFGHEKGAFSGAVGRHLGYAERSSGGTLFLDEIGELSARMQSKLLRLVESRTFSRVGGEALLEFKGRLVCATNVDLKQATDEGKFRNDLYYRINVVAVEVPPLRARGDDVTWLAERFLGGLSEEFEHCPTGLSELAASAIRNHSWPGNVRELRNRLERAALLAMGPWIMPGDLFPERAAECISQTSLDLVEPLETARDEAERRHIARALEATNGAIIPAAKLLQISRTTLWEKMRRLGVEAREPV